MNEQPSPRLLPLAAFTAAYMLAAVAGSMIQGNREFVFYIVIMLVLIAAVTLVHRKINLPISLLWALSIWGLAHMAGGLVALPKAGLTTAISRCSTAGGSFRTGLNMTRSSTAFGFGVTTWMCWHGLKSSLHQAFDIQLKPTFGLLVLSAAAGVGFGALNEVIEFIAVLTIPNTNVGGYENTGWDLVANLIGASLAAVIIWLRR